MAVLNDCEFCGKSEVLMVLSDHPAGVDKLPSHIQEVYVACPNCLVRLVTHSLTPQQYLRAKQAGRDMDRYYLHSDFYDQDTGTALQPMLERTPA